MPDLSTVLTLAHLIGLALGVGAATVKLTLLWRCRADQAFVPVFLSVARPVTGSIILGQVMLTLSGIGWLLIGYAFTPRLVVKVVLVGAIWVLGPLMDKKVEPRFRALAPAVGEPASVEFLQSLKTYLSMEIVATGLFYAIVLLWVLQ